jgi:hypothetical protein
LQELGPNAAAFKARPPRSKQGKDWRERIEQNARTLARVDYGQPLREVGFEVRTAYGSGAGLFRVNAPRKTERTAGGIRRRSSV